jgi:hypothetical protein
MLSKRPRVLLAEDHAELAKAVSRLLVLDCETVGTYRTAVQCWMQPYDSNLT